MFDILRAWVLWVLMLISPQPQKHLEVQDARSNQTYYVGLVAAEAAYATLLPGTPDQPKPTPVPIDPANCPTCKGLGKVPTGDSNHPWTKCPTCNGGSGARPAVVPSAPAASTPPCVSGTCSLQSPPVAAPESVPPSQVIRRR